MISIDNIYFTGISLPGGDLRPSQISPGNGYEEISLPVELMWRGEGVNLQLSTCPDFADCCVISRHISGNSYTIVEELDPGTTYYWRFVHNNWANNSTSVWSFTTENFSSVRPVRFPDDGPRLSLTHYSNNTLTYTISGKTDLFLDIYTLQGRKIKEYFFGDRNAGSYSLSLSDLPGGSYLLFMKSGEATVNRVIFIY